MFLVKQQLYVLSVASPSHRSAEPTVEEFIGILFRNQFTFEAQNTQEAERINLNINL